ncbi:nickel transporter permease [Propionibacterium australiense]|uniref:ABC transporter permease subunit n=1 Tax=Propionibacterium australiense TaxID=119981 RepID=A0A383S8S5_9ACTN|nr:nickel transporter permease [Propionibacterium australiense]RLP06498.1 ABC transporter permease subunit [Propionibacterium australiense]RLP06566.1 ABC transporter permease subunit [Propionibacterium australiense]SYZ34378.1 Binding-protein-dependent transport system inner membrane component [Propionibacterium australiense]VEH92063.1 Probable D,D-dipeptide transport system permease protein ddpC [Propionibacterium australiense]
MSTLHGIWRTIRRAIGGRRAFGVHLALVLVIALVAVFARQIAPMDPYAANLADAFQPPSAEHWFGTDKLGRDIASRIVYGTRISLTSAMILVLVISVVGSFLGVIAGYFGGLVDAAIMRISDMMISFPGIVLAIAVAGLLGASIRNAIIALAVVSWTKYARLARSLVLKIRHADFVTAAELNGTRPGRLMRRYLLPSALPTLVITAATDIGTMMLELAGLSFLGFGAQPPQAEWGLMLNEGRAYLLDSPWLMIFPGAAICITVIVFNLLGDALRDVLDPRHAGQDEDVIELVPAPLS